MGSKTSATIWLIFANGINFLVTFLSLPFLARTLAVEQYGTYAQFILLSNMGLLVFALGIPSVINVLLSQNKGDERGIVANVNGILIASVLVCSGIVLGAWGYPGDLMNNPHLKPLLPYLLVYMAGLIMGAHLPNIAIIFSKVRGVVLIGIAANIIRLLLMALAIYVLESFTGLMFFVVVSQLLQTMASALYLKKEIGFYRLAADMEMWRRLLKLSAPILLTGLFAFGIIYLDGIIISVLMSTRDFAIYRNGAIEVPFLSTLYLSVASVLLPEISAAFYNNDWERIKSLKKLSSSFIAFFIYPVLIFFIFNGRFFITLYLSHKYVESSLIFSIYNIAVLLRITDYQDILLSSGKTRQILYANLVTFGICVPLNYLFIKYFGVLGGVSSYLISAVMLVIILIILSRKVINCRISDLFDFRKLLLITLISGTLSAVCLYCIEMLDSNVFKIGVAGVYFAIIYPLLLKLNLVDKSFLLNSLLKKFPNAGFIHKIVK